MAKKFGKKKIVIGVIIAIIIGVIWGTLDKSESKTTIAEKPVTAQPESAKTELTLSPADDFVRNSDNRLMWQKPREVPVMNGLGTDRIGTRAYVELEPEEFEALTLENYTEFYQYFKDKDYNWVSVLCSDGTGVIFTGGGPYGQFGYMDDEGRLDGDTVKTITYYDDIDKFVERKPSN
jgi:hypothetical protein